MAEPSSQSLALNRTEARKVEPPDKGVPNA
jgi:hypothetical protein